MENLKAESWIYNMDGEMISHHASEVDVAPYSNEFCHCIRESNHKDLSEVHFLKMELSKGDGVISENFYWRSNKGQDYTALDKLPEVNLNGNAHLENNGRQMMLTVELQNPTDYVVFFNRLRVVGNQSGENILPIFYDDNYFTLLPNEKKTVDITFDRNDLNGESPRLMLEGWNADSKELGIE